MKIFNCFLPLLALCVLSALADNNNKNKNKDNKNDMDNNRGQKYSGSYGDWKKVGKCERPKRDECSKEGTCCGEMEGEQRYKRKCSEKGECNPDMRTEKTKSCNLTCKDEDDNDDNNKGSYGEWQSLGCSVTCGKGTETFVRECDCPGSCDGYDSKTVRCKRPACDDDDHHSDNDDDNDDHDDHDDDDHDDDDEDDDDDFSRYGPWEWVNQCDRPDEGKCSEEGTCCDKRKGERKLVRECKVAGNCNPKMRNKKTVPCTIKCDADYGRYGAWKRSDECERPNRGECSKDGSCCNELRGERKYKRKCSEKNTCHPKVISERTVACMIKCDDE